MDNEIFFPEFEDEHREITPLYSLPIKGYGTSQVESLNSYFQRLAIAHSTTPSRFLRSVLPRLTKTEMELSTLRAIYMKNGGQIPPNIINPSIPNLLQHLTGVGGLQHLTLLPIGRTATYQKSTGNVTRFCPECVDDDIKAGELPYERLAWKLNAVSTCHVHSCELRTAHCPKILNPKKAKLKIFGVCPDCETIGYKCGSIPTPNSSPANLETDYIKMIELLPRIEDAPAGAAKETLRRYCSETDGGIAGLAYRAGFAKTTFWHWLKGDDTRCRLETLEAVRASEGISMGHLLCGNLVFLDEKSPKKRIASDKKVIDTQALRTCLEKSLLQKNCSLTQVRKETGVDAKTLKRYHPELAHQVTEMAISRRKESHEKISKIAVTQAKNAIATLISQGMTPTLRNISTVTGERWHHIERRSLAFNILANFVSNGKNGSEIQSFFGSKNFRLEIEKAKTELKSLVF